MRSRARMSAQSGAERGSTLADHATIEAKVEAITKAAVQEAPATYGHSSTHSLVIEQVARSAAQMAYELKPIPVEGEQ